MRKYKIAGALTGLLLALPLVLPGCADSQTVTEMKVAEDTMAAYHLADQGALAYLQRGTATDAVKSDIKLASAAALAPLTALDNAIQGKATLTQSLISEAEAALASLQGAIAEAQVPATSSTSAISAAAQAAASAAAVAASAAQ